MLDVLSGLLRIPGLCFGLRLAHSDRRFDRRRFGFFFGPVRARRARRSRRLIALDEVLGEDALLFVPRPVCVFAIVPFGILHSSDSYNLSDWKTEVVIMARSILEDRFNRKRRGGHLASRAPDFGGTRVKTLKHRCVTAVRLGLYRTNHQI